MDRSRSNPSSSAIDAGVAAASQACAEFRARRDHAIATDPLLRGKGPSRPGATADAVPDVAPWRRCHLGHQRAMAAGSAPLRLQVRAALAAVSTDGARLAALDAVMAGAIGAREGPLLAMLPDRLALHFQRLQPAPGPALAGFGGEMQAVLRAELALRLQPIDGMLEAMGLPARA